MLSSPITTIKGIGPRRAQALEALGLVSMRDALYLLPRAYLDYSKKSLLAELSHGTDAAVEVTLVTDPRLARVRGGLNILSAQAYDESGKVVLTWYNQPYRKNALHAGDHVFACGRVDRSHGAKLLNPTIFHALPGILAVYPAAKGVSQPVLRALTKSALDACKGNIPETLPAPLREKYALLPLERALRAAHLPVSLEEAQEARRRLAFEDMLLYFLMLELLRAEREALPGRAMALAGVRERFQSKLPFALTGAQKRAMEEIAADLAAPSPMNRLLQGDVGSGKTALALFAMDAAIESGMQAALMAPTEILAAQHYDTLCGYFDPSAVCFLHGGMKKAERDAAYDAIRTSHAKAVVGTHALLQGGVEFFDLGLVVTDEQHRFGVRQRALLSGKGCVPDVLIMSATPIPRTLALMLYGDLSVSVLDELPPGRKPIDTRFVPAHRRADMYGFLHEQVQKGRQAYVVCPLVEKSDALEDVKSAEEIHAELKKMLPDRIGLLHGQMRTAEKSRIAEAFRRGEIDILVATTVIEVGVDVPNAAVMVIENADRFGLAQLHQLRGRVGRGAEKSYCFLLSCADGEAARARLATLCQTQDGFAIAQKDLELRGPGEFLGKEQHGASYAAAMLLAADLSALKNAQEAARSLLSPEFSADAKPLLARAREKLAGLAGEIAPN